MSTVLLFLLVSFTIYKLYYLTIRVEELAEELVDAFDYLENIVQEKEK